MKKILTILILTLSIFQTYAQSPERLVREYARLMDDYIRNGNIDSRDKILNEIFSDGVRISDRVAIVTLSADGSSQSNIYPSKYVERLRVQNKDCSGCLTFEIQKIKLKTEEEYVNVSAKIKISASDTKYKNFYYPSILYDKFRIKDNRISLISYDVDFESEDKKEINPSPVQRTEPEQKIVTNHEYVDLGLPSGTLWATCNVGANNPWEYGDYFAWGETATKPSYSWSNYKYANGASSKLTKYCNITSYGNNGFTDSRTTLESTDDVACLKWGSDWCIPTETQWQELEDKCTWSWTSHSGKNGYKITGPNGNSIFLPAAGHKDGDTSDIGFDGVYWSSSLETAFPDDARYIDFGSSYVYTHYYAYRFFGCSVRPVRYISINN